MENNKITIMAVVGIILLSGVFFYLNSTTKSGDDMAGEDEEMVMEQDAMEVDPKDMLMSDEDTMTVELADVSGGTSTGTAYVLRKEGKLYHSVTAELPEPAEGVVYEGWLVKTEPSLLFISTGTMTMEDEGMYSLIFTADQEFEGYNQVVITAETEVDATPEEHVLEGEFVYEDAASAEEAMEMEDDSDSMMEETEELEQ